MKVISISGGRSSAMMLKIMQDNGQIEDDDLVVFANTGKESEATLKFIQECSIRWGIDVVWLEFRHAMPKYKVVDFATASRSGNPVPFDELLQHRKYLPNPTQRICTAELKIKTIRRYVRKELKHKGLIDTYIGLRYDERPRVAKKKAQNASGKEAEFFHMPLYEMRITVKERNDFWAAQPFDLQISSHSDNCDFCFMKGKWHLINKIRENPGSVDWWIQKEDQAAFSGKRKRHGQFRKEYSYRELKEIAEKQIPIPFIEDQPISLTCSCTD